MTPSDPTRHVVRDIAARIWRDHYLGGDESHDLGPIDDTDRADANSVIAALDAEGVAVVPAAALPTTPTPSLDAIVSAAVEWVDAHDAVTLGMVNTPDAELLERYSEASNDLLAVVSQNRAALSTEPDES